MCGKLLFKCLFVFAVGIITVSAQGAVIIDDNFNGTAGSLLNSSYWVVDVGNTLNGDGTAHIASVVPGVGTGLLYASPSTYVVPTASQYARATYYVSNAPYHTSYGFGAISMRDDLSDTWQVSINGSAYFDTGAGRDWNWGGPTANTIQISWYVHKVVIYFDGGKIFDSSVNGSGWTFPTVPGGAQLGGGYGAWDVDHVVVETLAAPPSDPNFIGVLFDDNFNGSSGASLDSSYWVANANNTLNGDGTATIANNGDLTALSDWSVAPTAARFVRATFYISAAQWNMGYQLTDGGSNTILLRNDEGSPFDGWSVYINGTGYATGIGKPYTGGAPVAETVQIDYYKNKVVVAYGGSIIFDSSVNAPTQGGSWTIPTASLYPAFFEYYGSCVADRVVFATKAPLVSSDPNYAGVIIDDNFNGPAGASLDPNYWSEDAGNTLIGDGDANIAGQSYSLHSTLDTYVAPTASKYVRATIYVSKSAWNSAYSIVGPGASILMRDDIDGFWHVQINGQDFNTNVGRNWNWSGAQITVDQIEMDWYTNEVVIKYNGPTIFDSSLNGSGWVIPTVPCGLSLGAGYSPFDLDRVTVEKVCMPNMTSPADLNGDCRVDFKDLEIMIANWLDHEYWVTTVAPQPAPALTAEYDFESLDATDSTGQHNGTIVGYGLWASGIIGDYAMEFAGSNGTTVDCGTFNPSASSNAVTVALWLNWLGTGTTAAHQGMVAKEDSWDVNSMMWALSVGSPAGDSLIRLMTPAVDVQFPMNMPTEQWTHVAVSCNGTAATLYVNGQNVGVSVPFTFGRGTGAHICLGSMSLGDDAEGLNGTLDDVRIYNYALSAAEVGYLAIQGSGQVLHSISQDVGNLYNQEPAGSRAINFKDMAVLARDWLKKY